jgi:DNA mismatch endonuclease (patch repair protein)
MSAIRSVANKTEVALGRRLHSLGLRYRKYASIHGKPDLVFPTERVAVFVDGDYWHGRLLVERGQRALRASLRRLKPTARQYWTTKFTRRVQRDADVTSTLQSEGWCVIRLWESDVKRDIDRAATKIARRVEQRRADGFRQANTASALAKRTG